MSDSKQVVNYQPTGNEPGIFNSTSAFEHGQRIAMMLSKSQLVPKAYQGPEGIPNVMVALELANRIGMSPLMVMQNIHIIEGKPTWSAPFMIASLNTCGKFSPLRFEMKDLGKKVVNYTQWVADGQYPNGKPKKKPIEKTHTLAKNLACRAVAKDLSSGESIEGPWITLEMAVAEGWFHRNGSKWPTMEDSMLRYRAASFFGRLYAPEIGMGMKTADEVEDIEFTEIPVNQATTPAATPRTRPKVDDLNAKAEEPGKTPENAPNDDGGNEPGGDGITDAEIVGDDEHGDPPNGDGEDDDDI
jgi:hypothetical protein